MNKLGKNRYEIEKRSVWSRWKNILVIDKQDGLKFVF